MYAALLLTGFLGSLGHCTGMCGPLVMMISVGFESRGLSAIPRHLVYHGSRIGVYVLLGLLVAALGSLLRLGEHIVRLTGVVSLILGLLLMVFGLGSLGLVPLGRVLGHKGWWARAVAKARERKGYQGLALLGAVNGLLPCGLVYSALLMAAAAGSAPAGGAGMLAFGAGTIPVLLVLGVGAASLDARLRIAMRRIAGLVILLVSIQLILRGFAALGVIAHLHLGRVMLW
jgi:sulfite exporter TauE/SafE